MRLRPALFALLIAFGALAARAQDQPPKIDPAKEADIRRMLQATGANQLGQQMAQQMLTSIRPSLEKMLPEGNDRAKKFFDTMLQKFTEQMKADSMSELLVPLYDKYFTHDEIKALIQFYESPLGRKLITTMPNLMQDSMRIGSEWGRRIMQKVLLEMEEEYPELKQLHENPPKKN